MHEIFLSYTREDAPEVAHVRRALEGAGYRVWQDIDLGIGPTWRPAIETKLHEVEAVMVVWSERSVNSPFVRDEAQRAGDRLMQLCIAPATPPLGLNEYNALYLKTWPSTGEELAPVVQAAQHRLENVVFVTALGADLAAYRPAILGAAAGLGFAPIFSAGKTVDARRIAAARAVIAVVAHKHQPLAQEECAHARQRGKPVLAFVVDEKHTWPEEQKETHRLQETLQAADRWRYGRR